jgi:hypothetical protein
MMAKEKYIFIFICDPTIPSICEASIGEDI